MDSDLENSKSLASILNHSALLRYCMYTVEKMAFLFCKHLSFFLFLLFPFPSLWNLYIKVGWFITDSSLHDSSDKLEPCTHCSAWFLYIFQKHFHLYKPCPLNSSLQTFRKHMLLSGYQTRCTEVQRGLPEACGPAAEANLANWLEHGTAQRAPVKMLSSPAWLQEPIKRCFRDGCPGSSSLIGKVGMDENIPAEKTTSVKRKKQSHYAFWRTGSWNQGAWALVGDDSAKIA